MDRQAKADAPGCGQAPTRLRLRVRGRVQGVGFRPFVYRVARETGLAGHVGNDSSGVFIEVEGRREDVEAFARRLREEAPPAAAVASVEIEPISPLGESGFRIVESRREAEQSVEIAPDLAVCADCLREMRDPTDRRHGYPFINCVNCGPRYSIVRAAPYDRPYTTMARFEMCPLCRAEYEDPSNRRFHAQPNACPVCGPRLMLTDRDGCELGGDPVAECAALLRGGAIVAVKGVGGFHLACRADDNDAVGRLRERKGRESKPFALMARDLAMAARLVEFEPGGAAERALTDPSRPIVLLPRRADAPVSPLVAPGNPLLGVMLPYAPVHHLLFDHDLGPLVMTSANPSEEPLCADNTEAQRRLRSISDALLVHDRDIERRVDDSVLLAARLGTNDEIVFPLRRARGFTPAPIRWTRASAEPVLALGGEMKSTICLLRGRDAVLSEHLGELSNPAAFRNFVQAIDQFQRLLSVAPRVVAHDLHPDYASTRHALGLARDEGRRLVPVQHHHAHLAACLAENEADGPAVGVICDGTGHGLDGQVWGCEILSGDARNWRRAGRLWYYPLPGGDSAARECWRPALGLLIEAFGADWREVLEELPALLDKTLAKGVNLVASRLDAWKESIRQPGSGRPAFAPVLTSSLGRLFDAVAFLSGVCAINRHEAEAAMLLEAEVGDDGALRAEEFPWEYREPEGDSPFVLDIRPTIRAIVEGALGDVGARELSGRFHASLIAMLARGAVEAARRDGLGRVALSGGCFANRVLLRGLVERLRAAGLEVLIHRKTPPGDGCVALGQAVCAAARLESGEDL